MISEELLSKVMNDIVSDVEIRTSYGHTYITYDVQGGGFNPVDHIQINIHELAHKCKEWANKQGLYIKSMIRTDGVCNICEVNKYGYSSNMELFLAPTEPQAIFEACQWILDNETTK